MVKWLGLDHIEKISEVITLTIVIEGQVNPSTVSESLVYVESTIGNN